MNKKVKLIFNRSRNRIVEHLTKLQKKYGEPIFSSALRRKLALDRGRNKAQREIALLQKQMEKLKRGLLP